MIVDILSFAGLNVAIVYSAIVLMNRLWDRESEHASALHYALRVCVLYHSLIVLIEVILGVVGLLSLLWVSIATYLLCGVLIICRGHTTMPQFERKPWQLQDILISAIVFGPIAGVLLIRLCNALLQIPLEFDAHVYHLPIATEWLQTKSILNVYFSAFAGPLGYYPSMYELLYAWYMMPFQSDLLVNILNVPLFIFIICAVYAILRELNVSRRAALIGCSFPLYVPVFTHQLGTIFVDTFFTLNITCAVFFLVQLARGKQVLLSSILLGMSTGLFMGTKYLGLAYCLPILFSGLAIYGFRWRDYQYRRGSLIALVHWCIFGSLFYLRNWWNAGNPVFPVEVSIGNWNIFEGYHGTDEILTGTSILSHIFELSAWKALLSAFTTMWDFPGWLLLLCIPAFIIIFFKAEKRSEHRYTTAALAFGVIAYALLYSMAPYSWRNLIHNVRFAMPMLAVGSIAFGYTLDHLSNARIKVHLYILVAVSFAHSFWALLSKPAYKMHVDIESVVHEPRFSLLVCVTVGILASAFFIHTRRARTVAIVFGSILAVMTLSSSNILREKWTPYFIEKWYPANNPYSTMFEASRWLDDHDPEANIAYTGFHFHYTLVGRSLARRVEYININNCRECRYVDFRNNPASIRSDPDYSSWLNTIRLKEKKYLVVHTTMTPNVRMYEYEWAMEHPESFTLEFQIEDLFIFRII